MYVTPYKRETVPLAENFRSFSLYIQLLKKISKVVFIWETQIRKKQLTIFGGRYLGTANSEEQISLSRKALS